jgi:hypothetical protein
MARDMPTRRIRGILLITNRFYLIITRKNHERRAHPILSFLATSLQKRKGTDTRGKKKNRRIATFL